MTPDGGALILIVAGVLALPVLAAAWLIERTAKDVGPDYPLDGPCHPSCPCRGTDSPGAPG